MGQQSVTVFNLMTQEKQIFACISPAKAVVCAHEQKKGNWNTWTYDFGQAHFGPSGTSVFCGDWGAIVKGQS